MGKEQGLPGEQPNQEPVQNPPFDKQTPQTPQADPNQSWGQPQDDRPFGQEGTEPEAAGVPVTPQTEDPIQEGQPGYPSSRANEVIDSLEEQADKEEGTLKSGDGVVTDTENFAADPNPRVAKTLDPAETRKRPSQRNQGDREESQESPAVDERLPNP